MSRRKAPSGESESLNGLLDTMTNVIGVLILMLLASSLSMKQVMRIVDKKSALLMRAKPEQVSVMRMETASLDETLAALRLEAASFPAASHAEDARRMLVDAGAVFQESRSLAGGFLEVEPQAALADYRLAEERLAALKAAVALQDRELAERRAGNMSRPVPKPKTRIAKVPDPVSPPKEARGSVFLCRYGRVTAFDQQKMDAALKEAYEAATRTGDAKSLPLPELFRKVESYFEANEVGTGGFRWRVRGEYDANESTAKTYIQLRASVEWTQKSLGETLEQIQEKGAAFRGLLEGLSPKANYLKFVVWPDSFAEYAVAREIADGYQLSSGWIPQPEAGGVDVVLARALQKVETPLEAPRIAQRPRYRGPGLPHINLGGGGGSFGVPSFGGGGGGAGGAVGGLGGGGDRVD